jgi:hypothetical protein
MISARATVPCRPAGDLAVVATALRRYRSQRSGLGLNYATRNDWTLRLEVGGQSSGDSDSRGVEVGIGREF